MRSLSLSLVLHIAVLGLLLALGSIQRPLDMAQNSSLEISTLSPQELSQKISAAHKAASEKAATQIVQAEKSIATDAAPNEKEKVYLSKTNQLVDINTKAPRVGKFKNVLKEGIKDSSKTMGKTATQQATAHTPEMQVAPSPVPTEGLFKLAPKYAAVPQEDKNSGRLFRGPASVNEGAQGEGFSASNDHLPDVAIGANTLLNTREYKYYSFYERIRDQLSNQWEWRVKNEIDGMLSGGNTFNGERITKVVVNLDSNGELKTTKVLLGSGHLELDRAATQAFAAASPFPNPPQDLIQNGEVQIHWDFVVTSLENAPVQVQIKRSGY